MQGVYTVSWLIAAMATAVDQTSSKQRFFFEGLVGWPVETIQSTAAHPHTTD